MLPDELIRKLYKENPELIFTGFDLPKPYKGTGKIKAIILGADPTKIVDEKPIEMRCVFEIDNPK